MKVKSTVDVTKIFETKILSDVEFLVRNRNNCEIRIKAHKAILASRSTVFEKMFCADLDESFPVEVRISDVYAEAFTEFLQFFYLPEFDLAAENIADVLLLIVKYNIPDFLPNCELFMRNTATVETVYPYYELAMMYDLSDDTKDYFQDIITAKPEIVFQTAAPGGSRKTVLHHILSTFQFECEEITVFNAVVMWATKSLNIKGMEATNDALKTEIGECLYLIRFPLMSIVDLLGCAERYPNFLQFNEYMDISHYITSGRELSIGGNFQQTMRVAKRTESVSSFPVKSSPGRTTSIICLRTMAATVVKLHGISFMGEINLQNDFICEMDFYKERNILFSTNVAFAMNLADGRSKFVFEIPLTIKADSMYSIILKANVNKEKCVLDFVNLAK